MIKSITLRNYKSHSATRLDLSDGITVITGAPQSGKSNVLRGVSLVNTNKPRGFKYHSDFAPEDAPTRITIETDSGKVTFKRTKSATVYTVIQNGTKYTFRKLNKSVPDKVLEVLRLSDINLDRQFDSPYLITSHPTEIAKAIMKTVKYEKAAEWLAKLNKIALRTRTLIKLKKDELTTTKKNLECYEELPRATELGNLLEKTQAKLEKAAKRVSTLTKTYDEIVRLSDLEVVDIDLLNAQNMHDEIEEVRSSIQHRKEAISILVRLDAMSQIPNEIPSELHTRIEGIVAKIVSRGEAIKLLNSVNVVVKTEAEIRKQRRDKVSRLAEVLKQCKQCPVCKSPTTKATLHHLQSHYKKEDV